MIPFKNAIEAGADAIMIGHINVRSIDRWYPASLSRIVIQKYLRRKLKFKGLVITDDLKMLAIRLKYSQNKAVKLAINAGNNLIVLGLKSNELINVINDTVYEVKRGRIKQCKIDNSVKKIIEMKKKYNVNDKTIKGINIDKINKEIDQLNQQVEMITK